MTSATQRTFAFALCFVVACGSPPPGTDAGSAQNDAGADAADVGAEGADVGPIGNPSTTYPAPHAPLPQIERIGPTSIASPHIRAVTFAGEDAAMRASIEDFIAHVGDSSWWASTTSNYGTRAAIAEAPVELSESAPAMVDDADIQAWLTTRLNGDDPAFAGVLAFSVVVLFYPAGTVVTVSSSTGCRDFGAYHSEVTLDAAHGTSVVPYVVVPRCAGSGSLTGIDAVTASASGALVDAAVDPQGLASVDTGHFEYALVYGTEPSQMCGQDPASFATFPGLAYTVQRTWSNAAAAADHDPCQPTAPGEVYFAAVPVLPDLAMIPGVDGIDAVRIPVGSDGVVQLDLFSDAATSGPITVTAFDYATIAGASSPALSFTLETDHGLNGQHLFLRVHALRDSPLHIEPFIVRATVGSESHDLIGLVSH